MHSPTPPSFIYWYKEGRVINYSQRGGISVLTERKTRTSKLVISKAMASDSGNYTCIPSSSGELIFIEPYRFFIVFISRHNNILISKETRRKVCRQIIPFWRWLLLKSQSKCVTAKWIKSKNRIWFIYGYKTQIKAD